MGSVLAISIGAVCGANARYFLGLWCARVLGPDFPYGTLIINVSGSFVLGYFLTWSTEKAMLSPLYKLAVAIGFCGGYTTFSSYSFESVHLLQEGRPVAFFMNLLCNNVLALMACMAGMYLARRF